MGGVCRKENKMGYTVLKPIKQERRIVRINTECFEDDSFDTLDVNPLHIPIEYNGETYNYVVPLFNGAFIEFVPVKAIHNPKIGDLEIISLLINDKLAAKRK